MYHLLFKVHSYVFSVLRLVLSFHSGISYSD